jgi:periplasmic divalent cation tolerance protein
MQQASPFSLVVTSVDTREGADLIIARALDLKLAACVQVTAIESHYVWEGERRTAPELMLTMKIKSADYADLAAAICDVHPYETPEILRIDIAEGDPRYLDWLRAVTR